MKRYILFSLLFLCCYSVLQGAVGGYVYATEGAI